MKMMSGTDIKSKAIPSNTKSFPLILGTGAAYGNHYTTEEMLSAMILQQKEAGNHDFDAAFARRVFAKCGFEKHSVALELSDVFRRFSRSEYLEHRAKSLTGLAEQACEAALEYWGRPRSEITHLFWGTMTGGMHSPTTDIALVKRLGLDHDVERTSMEGMGCLTGFRLLNLARQVVQNDPKARILVIAADLRSAIGNSLPDKPTRSDIVSAALFRDAASAAVVGADSLRQGETPCFEIITGLSRVVKDTHHSVMYCEGDGGVIRLHLDAKLPDHICCAEPDFIATLLEKGRGVLAAEQDKNITLPPVTDMNILCHTGGPKILQKVAESVGVNKSNLNSSWAVMTAHGNLSGASNLAVLDHHNRQDDRGSEWSVCLSMGPGVCLEGVLLRDLRRPVVHIVHPSTEVAIERPLAKTVHVQKKVVHIVGGGIAGLTLATALDPEKFQVRVFESSPETKECGYGMAAWPSMIHILRDQIGVAGLDLATTEKMVVHPVRGRFDVKVGKPNPDKGFIQRSHLLDCIKAKLDERHPGCISTGHSCMRVRFEGGLATATYATASGSNVSHSCNLLVGADGVNSTVRQYVALQNNTKLHGHMTAYRFLVPKPSEALLKETRTQWNMSLGKHIHSPCYHISSKGNALNVVVLEYDGKPPGPPRRPDMAELMDVASRGNLHFIIRLLQNEKIEGLACFSTYHVDCEPWVQPCAAIIGDAAHAFGPLTAKMANLAINDAYTLATMLNHGFYGTKAQAQVLQEWEAVQRPKFHVTRRRTSLHLQLYSPQIRDVVSFLWKVCPSHMLRYFGSIFAYDYTVFSPEKPGAAPILGNSRDPLFAMALKLLFVLFLLAATAVAFAVTWKYL